MLADALRASSARAISARRTGTSASASTSPSATERDGTTSGSMPCSRSARAVPGPITAIVGPVSARASRTRAMSSWAPFGLVMQTRS